MSDETTARIEALESDVTKLTEILWRYAPNASALTREAGTLRKERQKRNQPTDAVVSPVTPGTPASPVADSAAANSGDANIHVHWPPDKPETVKES